MHTDKEHLPENSSKYKIQIFSQAFVYQRRNSPKKEMQKTEFGIELPVLNWYDEFECKQLAVNHNSLYIKEGHVREILNQLNEGVIQSLKDKGLIA